MSAYFQYKLHLKKSLKLPTSHDPTLKNQLEKPTMFFCLLGQVF